MRLCPVTYGAVRRSLDERFGVLSELAAARARVACSHSLPVGGAFERVGTHGGTKSVGNGPKRAATCADIRAARSDGQPAERAVRKALLRLCLPLVLTEQAGDPPCPASAVRRLYGRDQPA